MGICVFTHTHNTKLNTQYMYFFRSISTMRSWLAQHPVVIQNTAYATYCNLSVRQVAQAILSSLAVSLSNCRSLTVFRAAFRDIADAKAFAHGGVGGGEDAGGSHGVGDDFVATSPNFVDGKRIDALRRTSTTLSPTITTIRITQNKHVAAPQPKHNQTPWKPNS